MNTKQILKVANYFESVLVKKGQFYDVSQIKATIENTINTLKSGIDKELFTPVTGISDVQLFTHQENNSITVSFIIDVNRNSAQAVQQGNGFKTVLTSSLTEALNNAFKMHSNFDVKFTIMPV